MNLRKKMSNTLKFSLMVLLLAIGSGVASGVVAYHMGVEAIKGVNQPDNNPSKKFSNAKKPSALPQAFKPIDEKEIIKKAEKTIRDKQANAKKEQQKSP
jgi:hypothetical protein